MGMPSRRALLSLHMSPALCRTWVATGSTAHLVKTWELAQGLSLDRRQWLWESGVCGGAGLWRKGMEVAMTVNLMEDSDHSLSCWGLERLEGL